MNDYLMCVRAVNGDTFEAEVGDCRFLVIPPGQLPSPRHAIQADTWYKAVLREAVWKNEEGEPRGDILFVVHGYNNSTGEVIERHRILRDDLQAIGFKGVIVSFDWPSDNKALAYLPDRHRAKISALTLVASGIRYLSAEQTPSCTINIHVLGHSTGAYVIRQAFHDADDTSLPNGSWSVSQVVFAAGDISSKSMAGTDGESGSLYRHSIRVTNYFSRHDDALDLSNVKRLGLAPRVGRIGLPDDAPQCAIDVDCTEYYELLIGDASQILAPDQLHGFFGKKSHSWYFGNRMFTYDLFCVLIGKDRKVIPSRTIGKDGKFRLIHF